VNLETLLRALLRDVVLEAVADALADGMPEAKQGPVLVDREDLATALKVSVPTVDRLREKGMPTIMIGDCPRFEIAACVEWLRTRPAPDKEGAK
jgi:hypothetical protein